MKDAKWQVVSVVLVLLSAVATLFGITNHFVTQPVFEEYKASNKQQLGDIYDRLRRIEDKQDALLEEVRKSRR